MSDNDFKINSKIPSRALSSLKHFILMKNDNDTQRNACKKLFVKFHEFCILLK